MNSAEPEARVSARRIRDACGVAEGRGPYDENLERAVEGFAQKFEYWYSRVMAQAVRKYRNLIIKRINPFVRRIELDGLSPTQVADRLVADYNSRNFVTAGGWALEAMAISIGPLNRKSTAVGIDLERFDVATGDCSLYVLKSGAVTRNSDIVSAIKENSRQAEKRLRQDKGIGRITANYAILAGVTKSTFEDGIRRPSSGEFWSEMTGLGTEEAVGMVLAVAAEAGRLVTRDASTHTRALAILVREYIRKPETDEVDWPFIGTRTLHVKDIWEAEDKERHGRAMRVLASTGYVLAPLEKKAVSPRPKKRRRRG